MGQLPFGSLNCPLETLVSTPKDNLSGYDFDGDSNVSVSNEDTMGSLVQDDFVEEKMLV